MANSPYALRQPLRAMRAEGVGKSFLPTDTYEETMPTTRFVGMMSVAIICYLLQVGVSILFLSPAVSVGIMGGAFTAAACESSFHLGKTLCAGIGVGVGAAGGVGIAAVDTLSGGALTGFSNATGQLIASLIGFVAFVLFSLWYLLAGIRFFGSQRALNRLKPFAAQAILDVLPFVQIAPVLPIGVYLVCREARKEDREKLQARNEQAAQAQAQEHAEIRRSRAIHAARMRGGLPQGAY